jgi:pyruvate kinase
MLSGETAAGKYPVEALRAMAKIAERTERDIDYKSRFKNREVTESKDITSAISHATCNTAHDLDAVAIITVSKTGRTAKMISKFRPNCPIIGGTIDDKVLNQLNLSWGVIPMKVEEKFSTDELFKHVVKVACEHGYVSKGDIVVVTAGIPLGKSGTTNLIKVHIV